MSKTIPEIQYSDMSKANLSDQVHEQLVQTDGLIIKGFHVDKSAFVDFGHAIGQPIAKANFAASNVETTGHMAFLGDIRYKPNIDADKRMPTQDFRTINFHTARAYAEERPSFFCMLMYDQGWTGFEEGKNGEASLLQIDDFLSAFKIVAGKKTEEYLATIENLNLSYSPVFYDDDVGQGPLLWKEDGRDYFRFWEGITNDLPETLALVDSGTVQEDALIAVSQTLKQAKPSYMSLMVPGDIIVLDNRRVAHAREGFLDQRMGSSDQVEYSPRQVLNLQIV